MSYLFDTDSDIHGKIKAFQAGRKDLSAKDLNDIKIYLLEYKSLVSNIQFFEGLIKSNKVVSCFSETHCVDLVNHMHTKRYGAIAMVVSLATQKVYLSRDYNSCTINFDKLIELIFSNQYTAVDKNAVMGPITDNFLKLSKQLSVC